MALQCPTGVQYVDHVAYDSLKGTPVALQIACFAK